MLRVWTRGGQNCRLSSPSAFVRCVRRLGARRSAVRVPLLALRRPKYAMRSAVAVDRLAEWW